MKTKKKPEPVKEQSQSQAVATVPKGGAVGEALDMSALAGQGLEGADKSSFAIPFLIILQSNSPQVADIKEAKAGMLMNSITGELFERLTVIPCYYQRRFIRWAPRSQGGGFKGEYMPDLVETNKVPGCQNMNGQFLMDVPPGAAPFDKDGKPLYDHLSDTRGHFILMKSATGAWQPALFSLGSTQIKKSKRWMSRIKGIEATNAKGKVYNPPMFGQVYSVECEEESNAKGTWWGASIDYTGLVTDAETLAAAQTFYNSVSAGLVETAPPVASEDVATGATQGRF